MTALPIFSSLPQALRPFPQWVLWRWEQRIDKSSGERKRTKVLYSPRTRRRARAADNPDKVYPDRACDTWGTFEQAVNAYQQRPQSWGGIGFVFTESDPFAGLDIDHCVENGVIDDLALADVRRLASYAEFSPSGTGIHVIVQADKPGPNCRPKKGSARDGWEFYDRKRFLTFTGNVVPGCPADVVERPQAYADLWREAFPPDPARERPAAPRQKAGQLPDDAELLDKIRQSEQGDKFRALYDYGDANAYHAGDRSAADAALCEILAGWTQCDAARMERLFEGSALVRDKWQDRADYRRRTLEYAIDHCTWQYEPALDLRGNRTRSDRSHTSRPAEGERREETDVAKSRKPSAAPPPPETETEETQACEPETQEDEDEYAGPGESLCRALERMDQELNLLGVRAQGCGILFPPGTDLLHRIEAGQAMKHGTDYVTTYLNFLWASWYMQIPNRPHGAKILAVGALYGGADTQKARNEQQRLSELVKVARNIPVEYQSWSRPWCVYECAARMKPARRDYWLSLRPYRGMLRDMEADLHPEPEQPQEATPSGQAPEPSSPLLSPSCDSNTGADKAEETGRPGIAIAARTGEVMVISDETLNKLATLAARAQHAGITLEQYLQQLLDDGPLPKNTLETALKQVDKPSEQVDLLSETSDKEMAQTELKAPPDIYVSLEIAHGKAQTNPEYAVVEQAVRHIIQRSHADAYEAAPETDDPSAPPAPESNRFESAQARLGAPGAHSLSAPICYAEGCRRPQQTDPYVSMYCRECENALQERIAAHKMRTHDPFTRGEPLPDLPHQGDDLFAIDSYCESRGAATFPEAWADP